MIALESRLELPEEEKRVTSGDLELLAMEQPSLQANWSVDVDRLAMVTVNTDAPISEAQTDESLRAWLRGRLVPQRDLDAYYGMVLHRVVEILVVLQLAAPENPALWLVLHLRDDRQSSAMFFHTNLELQRKLEQIKSDQQAMHLRLERLALLTDQLQHELTLRDQFIQKLSAAHLTTRTQAIMDGTPVFLNLTKHWVLPGHLLQPSELDDAQLLALQRAERFCMERDETRWRFLLKTQKRYEASVAIQSKWRGFRAHTNYQQLRARRRQAAVVIQRNYFHYLFHRALSLPDWCVLGREVLVAPSVSLKCAIQFQFYPKKDFATGNYKRLEHAPLSELLEFCRLEEECAGFSTDGALKRFLPRKLSQLQSMAKPKDRELTPQDGLYIKVFPAKGEPVVNTAIVIELPPDRFGLIRVVLDGSGVVESVPLAKLSDRWKRVCIRRKTQREKKPKARTYVFGKAAEPDAADEVRPKDFEVFDDGLTDQQRARRRKREQSEGQGDADDDAAAVDFFYEDQATTQVLTREPKRTFTDDEDRAQEIQRRKVQYQARAEREYEAKKLASAVRLQCAWRSKRAREAFRRVLELRAKEREREREVHRLHQQQEQTQHKSKAQTKPGFFAKWRRA